VCCGVQHTLPTVWVRGSVAGLMQASMLLVQAITSAHITLKLLPAQFRAGNMIAGIQQQTMSVIICAHCFHCYRCCTNHACV
jgi:hypothetical protein